MSTIDRLKQAQMQRIGDKKGTDPEGACPRDFKKMVVPADEIKGPVPVGTRPRDSHWLISLILSILIVSNLGFTFKLFLMTKEYSVKGNNSQKNLSLLGKAVTDQASKINSMSASINQLEKQANSQALIVEKLIKTNNALFTKVNSIGSKLDQIVKQPN